MASGVEPFREHELSFELSTPDWLSLIGLKAAARYADVETDVVIQRVIDDESFGDALVTAGKPCQRD